MALTAIVHHRADWARRASIIALASSPDQPNPLIDVDPPGGEIARIAIIAISLPHV
jgi:hypothetical protein